MLRQGTEICVVAPIAGCGWALGYGPHACLIVTQKRELVEELARGMTKIFAIAGT